jgi:hypothetical protein
MILFGDSTFIAGLKPHGSLALVKVVGIAQLLLAALLARRFSALVPARPGDRLNFAPDLLNTPEELAKRAELRKASEADALALKEIADPARVQELSDQTRAKWQCSGCGSENPETFDLCWKCQRIRPDAGTSNYRLERP